MKLAIAQRGANRLLSLFSPTGVGYVAGSVRRQKPKVGDIELMLPLPAEGQLDRVYEAMKNFVWAEPPDDTPRLFGPTRTADQRFIPVKGFKPGFKYAQIEFQPESGGDPAWLGMKVDVFRYTPGPAGNLGWQLLIRTGSADFSQACAGCWLRQMGRLSQGSEGGFLLDGHFNPIATPTEESAFEVLGIEWVEPRDRLGGEQVKRKRGAF